MTDLEKELNIEKETLEDEEQKDKFADEHYRLAGRPELKTILILSIGPVLSQITAAISGVISTIWVSKAIGDKGMTAISTYTAFDNIGRSFGFFCSVAGSQCISSCFGAGEGQESAQVICDLLRMCFVFGAFVPAVLCPTVKMGVKWFGASDEIVELGYEYMLPLLVGTVFTCIFTAAGGFLQGEGRSGLYGWIVIASLASNVLVFAPLLLFVAKTGIVGAGVATVMAEGIPGIIIMILYFNGKFGVKPKFNQMFKCFSPKTFPALRVGLSQLIANLSVCIPGIIIRKLIGMCASDETMFNDSLAGYNVIFRYAQVTNSVIISITMGYLPAASYAYSAENYQRWLRLSMHSFWIGFVWGTITSILSWSMPRQISMIFSKGEGYLKWAGPMVQVGNALGFIVFGRFCFPSVLQSMKKGMTSTLLSLASQLISIIGFGLLLYYTDKTDPVRICWCYPLSYAFGLVAGFVVLGPPIYNIYKKMKEQQSQTDEEKQEVNIASEEHQEEELAEI